MILKADHANAIQILVIYLLPYMVVCEIMVYGKVDVNAGKI